MSGRDMKAVIWRLLPESPPGLTFAAILDELYLAGSATKVETLSSNLCLLRKLNALREDCTERRRRYWRGPFDPGPKPCVTVRPAWSYPDVRLLAEAHAAREEIRSALRRGN